MRNKTLDHSHSTTTLGGTNFVNLFTGNLNPYKNIPNAFLIFELEENKVIYSNQPLHQLLQTASTAEITSFLHEYLFPENPNERKFFFELLKKKKSEDVHIHLKIGIQELPINIHLFEIGEGMNLLGIMFQTQSINNAENQLLKALDLKQESWMLLDTQGKILKYNEGFAQHSQKIYIESLFFGLDLREHSKWGPLIIKALGGQKVIETLPVYIQKRNITFEISITPLTDFQKNTIEGVLFSVKDITNSLKAEELIVSSYDQIRNFKIALNRTSLVCVTNPRGYITEVNELFCKITGHSYDQLIGENLQKIFPSLALNSIYKNLSTTLKADSFWREEVQNFDKNSNPFWVDLMFSPVADQSGNVYEILCIAYPITERKNGETERQQLMTDLIQHNRNLEQFAFTISHKLRAPLARVIGLAELLKIDDYQNSHHTFIDKLLSSTKELDMLLKGLIEILSFRQQTSLEKKNIDLNHIIQTITSSLTTAIQENEAIIEIDLAENARSLHSIKSYIESIFYHLITNALKFRKKYLPPIIHIKSSKVEQGILLEVKDNGVGIDLKNNREKIFSMYQKLHSNHEGKGLGLYLVKSQVDELKGSVQVESAINQGTIFKIFLPEEE